ncbi:DUF3626 domain-containing protein [Sphingobacterium wenxiniae]|uniref:DUF3626 domain-containing protein n=1 Tax=Sphingobacterium wenxiniae TaxID=683125 RepID=UPI001113430F
MVQFQTNVSSGSLTAKIGGDRDDWENKLFDNFYATLLCEKFDISLIWNLGCELNDNIFPDDFRGIETKTFAKKIADNGIINAYIIGKALSNTEIKSQYNSLELSFARPRLQTSMKNMHIPRSASTQARLPLCSNRTSLAPHP